MQRVYPIEGKVQHYSWGGAHFIPALLGKENPDHEPFAEYWLGAHPSQSSIIDLNGKPEPLVDVLKSRGEVFLGKRVNKKFASLPYLFKVLDVKQMLSIQVHPSKKDASIEYDREEAAGIPITAPHRNYKDCNHKPEQMIALSDFWLLHGFKPAEKLQQVLRHTPELNFLSELFDSAGYEGLYKHVMHLSQGEVNETLGKLAQRILPLYEKGELSKSSEDFWACRAILSFCKDGHYDRGVFSVYLFNLVHLQKGEGIFQPAGLPHAYLEGQNVELMANSDNVLRAGLTDKHIDVPELLKHVVFEATEPDILKANKNGLHAAPAEEFALYECHASLHYQTESAEIIFIYEGEITIREGEVSKSYKTGEAVFVIAETTLDIVVDKPATYFRIAVPAV